MFENSLFPCFSGTSLLNRALDRKRKIKIWLKHTFMLFHPFLDVLWFFVSGDTFSCLNIYNPLHPNISILQTVLYTFLWCWHGWFVWQSGSPWICDLCLNSPDLNLWFKSDTVGEIRCQSPLVWEKCCKFTITNPLDLIYNNSIFHFCSC